MDALQTAMFWLNQGIATIPIQYRGKRPDFRKVPSWESYKVKLPEYRDILSWYSSLSNIAIVTGWRGLVVVDFDRLDVHDLWLATHGITDTYQVHTGRGIHYYYYCKDLPPHTLKWAGGEIKASGYCLIPPSVHPSGRNYQAVEKPILTINSIFEVVPERFFNHPLQGKCIPHIVSGDVYQPVCHRNADLDLIKQKVRVLDFFPDARKSGNGWYMTKCPLHPDGNHLSGWIDDRRNRYGCHCCITGSLSVIDFYMQLKNVSLETAIGALCVF